MLQQITEQHEVDENQCPTGGKTSAVGIRIDWQNGPLGRGVNRREPNGAFIEGVLQAAAGRLRFYQASKFSCRENALALTKIEEAILWLQARTQRREIAGIEGTHAEDSARPDTTRPDTTLVGHVA